MSRALIVNAYSVGNRGDAAIVQGMIRTLRAAGASVVTVAVRDWRADADAWHQLGADEVVAPLFATHDLPPWIRSLRPLRLLLLLGRWLRYRLALLRLAPGSPALGAYRRASLVVSVGGAYLGGPRLVINVVKAMNIAFGRAAGRPVVIAPITVNPPSGPVGRVLRWALASAQVFVRDQDSRSVLARLGVQSVVVPDVALRAGALAAARADAGARVEPADRRTPVLCCAPRTFRPTHDAWAHRVALDQLMADALSAALRSTDARLRFVSQVQATAVDDDAIAIDRIRSLMPPDLQARVEVAEPTRSLDDAVAQYAGCDVLLASRLHAGLMAMASGVSALVLGYEPKVRGVLAGLGLAERVVDPGSPGSAAELAERLLALRDPAERTRTLAAATAAEESFEPLDRALSAILGAPQRSPARGT